VPWRLRRTAPISSQKHAIPTPLLKKPYLDAGDLKNYRLVLNLVFMYKIAKKTVAEKLVSHLQKQDLLPRLQSAYRRHHPTETALLGVLSDIYAAADRQDVTLIGLLDLSAAFDCVDHDILVRRLQQSFGICSTELKWLQSFLHGRTQQVCYNGQLLAVVELLFGVPQASVFNPLLFLLHRRVVRHHLECWTCRTLVRRRHANVHQCSSRIRVGFNQGFQ